MKSLWSLRLILFAITTGCVTYAEFDPGEGWPTPTAVTPESAKYIKTVGKESSSTVEFKMTMTTRSVEVLFYPGSGPRGYEGKKKPLITGERIQMLEMNRHTGKTREAVELLGSGKADAVSLSPRVRETYSARLLVRDTQVGDFSMTLAWYERAVEDGPLTLVEREVRIVQGKLAVVPALAVGALVALAFQLLTISAP